MSIEDASHQGIVLGSLRVNKREQSRNEEFANSISHGVALLIALFSAPFLIQHAAESGDTYLLTSASLFCATASLLYLSSTIYHALPPGTAKRACELIDHCAIFLFIAGTYTPFTLGALRSEFSLALCGGVWCIAMVGTAMKLAGRLSNPLTSIVIYLLMGWFMLVIIEPLLARMALEGLIWLLIGNVFYTAGLFFYVTDSRLKYGHLVWHLFVVIGTACHYVSIFRYAI